MLSVLVTLMSFTGLPSWYSIRNPMPIGGIMSDRSGEWVDEKLVKLHTVACNDLGIDTGVEPIMTLCFMSLAVIPEIKLTDMGLFDVTEFNFIDINAV